jgi:hypothetical protein
MRGPSKAQHESKLTILCAGPMAQSSCIKENKTAARGQFCHFPAGMVLRDLFCQPTCIVFSPTGHHSRRVSSKLIVTRKSQSQPSMSSWNSTCRHCGQAGPHRGLVKIQWLFMPENWKRLESYCGSPFARAGARFGFSTGTSMRSSTRRRELSRFKTAKTGALSFGRWSKSA